MTALLTLLLLLAASVAVAHNVASGDRAFVENINGPAVVPFLYLGAKHMVTGYDHVLFLIGVVFFLYRLRDIVVHVSLFTLGHSMTLLGGVLFEIGGNAYIVDAIIGLSVAYKGADNIGLLDRFKVSIDTRVAILVFGIFHGMGLATKLMDLSISPNGLLVNLIGFNVGVELGQLCVLVVVVTWLNVWRRARGFEVNARYANIGLIISGILLIGVHIAGYIGS